MWKILIGSIHHVNPSWFNSFGVLEAIQTYSKLLGTSQRIWFPEVTLSDFSPQKPCHFDESRPGHFRPQDLKNEPIIPNQGSQTPKIPFRRPGNNFRPIGLDSDRFWQSWKFRLVKFSKIEFRTKKKFLAKNLKKSLKIIKIIENRSGIEFLLV